MALKQKEMYISCESSDFIIITTNNVCSRKLIYWGKQPLQNYSKSILTVEILGQSKSNVPTHVVSHSLDDIDRSR